MHNTVYIKTFYCYAEPQ